MTTADVQDRLLTAIEAIIDARDEVEGDGDDGTLADIARDLVDELEEVRSATTFERAMLLTSDDGIVLRMQDGSEFQLSIVQRR
ncbi:MAG: hypothetical protein IT435_09575 [Phycisphaerales bacterium]|nr:hypothetical protein [Phycisphaerales bacterium]